jgi:hypothetical protein
MSVGEKHVSDRILIEAELLQAIQDLVFRGIVEQGINDDDALPSHDGPCAMDLRTQEIEVIGDLRRFSIPGFSGGGTARRSTAPGRLQPGWNRNAETKESAGPIGAGGDFGRSNIAVNSSVPSCLASRGLS